MAQQHKENNSHISDTEENTHWQRIRSNNLFLIQILQKLKTSLCNELEKFSQTYRFWR